LSHERRRLRDKVAIVTGGGQGIGRGICKVFAAEGARVMIATRTEKHGRTALDEITANGGRAALCVADVGELADTQRVVAETLAAFGRVDILVHNAASFLGGPVEGYSEADLETVLAVNLKACFRLSAACIPHFRKQRWGRLLFTSSVTGPRVAMPGTSYYAASKGGVNAFIRTAALEVARDGITVNGIEPGYIRTAAMELLAGRGRPRADGEVHPARLHRRARGHRLRDALSRDRRSALRDGADTLHRRRLDAAGKPGVPRGDARHQGAVGLGRLVTTAELLERRFRVLGRGSPLFYDQPLHIVRGEGVWLYDADGRRYLDAYNNVPHVGHCHPHVVEAIARQAATLNTHTRYLHEGIVTYAERLTSLFDRELVDGVHRLHRQRGQRNRAAHGDGLHGPPRHSLHEIRVSRQHDCGCADQHGVSTARGFWPAHPRHHRTGFVPRSARGRRRALARLPGWPRSRPPVRPCRPAAKASPRS
jgi:3-oxoacyl-[acyl-carrier protein] reductase